MSTDPVVEPVPSEPVPSEPVPSERNRKLGLLLDRARDGGRDSLNEIVAELSPLLWQVARAQGLDREAAQDVVQTSWLSLLKNLDGIRTPAALTGWLVTVTKREAWRVARAGRGERPIDEQAAASIPDPAPAVDDGLLADERERALWGAVKQLTPRCQQLLRIVAFTHRPDYTAVSQALGMPTGSIGPTRGRCLAKLRDLLTSDPTWSAP